MDCLNMSLMIGYLLATFLTAEARTVVSKELTITVSPTGRYISVYIIPTIVFQTFTSIPDTATWVLPFTYRDIFTTYRETTTILDSSVTGIRNAEIPQRRTSSTTVMPSISDSSPRPSLSSIDSAPAVSATPSTIQPYSFSSSSTRKVGLGLGLGLGLPLLFLSAGVILYALKHRNRRSAGPMPSNMDDHPYLSGEKATVMHKIGTEIGKIKRSFVGKGEKQAGAAGNSGAGTNQQA